MAASNFPVPVESYSRKGFVAVGLFLFFGASMACFAGLTLLWPGTMFDRAWSINSGAHTQLVALGRTIGVPFLLLSYALALAAVGWFRRRLWAWRLAFVIVGTQALANLVNLFLGHLFEGSIGFLFASALLFCLVRPSIRSVFAQ